MRGALVFALVLLSSFPALAAEKWYVEFVGASFDEAQVRRAVALEMREVDIPGDPERPGDDFRDVALRILIERKEEAIDVSLWDRGTFTGRRRVTGSQEPRVLARRIGLAVGELGRQLAGHRVRVAHRLEREAAEERQKKAERAERARRRDLGLRVGAESLVIPQGAFLVGPGMGIEFNGHFPLRFSPFVAWMTGALPPLADATLGQNAPGWSAFEWGVAPDYLVPVSGKGRIALGAMAAAMAVHTSGATTVDEIYGQRDTWGARAGAKVGYEHQVTGDARLRIDLIGGSMLRRIPMRSGATTMDLGGGFVGLSLGVTLAPETPDVD